MKRLGAFVLTGILLFGAMGIVSGEDTTEAVDPDKLVPFLPDAPSGWERIPGIPDTIEEEGTSMAMRMYIKSGAEVGVLVAIMDSAFHNVGYQEEWKGYTAYDTPEGYAKSTKVKGFPAWEIYTKDTDAYSLLVGINDRFVVFIGPGSDKDTLYAFSDRINYKGIASLGGGAPPTEEEPTEGEPGEGVTDGEPAGGEAPEGEEPGFEAVFAIVGLLAVAYLVKRRR
jgi:PGF-CTERM protein